MLCNTHFSLSEIIKVFISSTKSISSSLFSNILRNFGGSISIYSTFHFCMSQCEISFNSQTLEHDYIIKLFPFTWLSVLTPFAIKKTGFCPALTVFTNFTKSVSFARITLRWTL